MIFLNALGSLFVQLTLTLEHLYQYLVCLPLQSTNVDRKLESVQMVHANKVHDCRKLWKARKACDEPFNKTMSRLN